MESKKYNNLVNNTKKRSRLTDIEKKLVITSKGGEGQYRGRGKKQGYHAIIKNHLCETFENCKALQNLKNLSFN